MFFVAETVEAVNLFVGGCGWSECRVRWFFWWCFCFLMFQLVWVTSLWGWWFQFLYVFQTLCAKLVEMFTTQKMGRGQVHEGIFRLAPILQGGKPQPLVLSGPIPRYRVGNYSTSRGEITPGKTQFIFGHKWPFIGNDRYFVGILSSPGAIHQSISLALWCCAVWELLATQVSWPFWDSSLRNSPALQGNKALVRILVDWYWWES